jgi:hypothetical protein
MKKWFCAFQAKFAFPLLLLLITYTGYSQNNNSLKANSSNAVKNNDATALIDHETEYIRRLYSERIEEPKELINGKEYAPYYLRSKLKPLLYSSIKRKATIITKTRIYDNLTLDYDTFLDEVLYTDMSKTINFTFPMIALNKDIVDGFNLYFANDSLIFRNLRSPECTKMNLKEGFYEIAYQGKSQYFIKHVSSFFVKEGQNEYKYSPENYISVGDTFYKIKNKKSLLKLFGESSGTIKKYLHMSRIRVRHADKDQFISILKYYDTMITAEKNKE